VDWEVKDPVTVTGAASVLVGTVRDVFVCDGMDKAVNVTAGVVPGSAAVEII
jgi:hypothetical protein